MSRADYQTLVDALIRDEEQKLSRGDRDQAITLAVHRYSQDRPREIVEDVVGDGSQALPLPANWEAGFSSLGSLEYPIGNFPPTYLELGAYGIYNAPGGEQIYVRDAVPNGSSVRATFTRAHQLSATADTIPQWHRELVAAYAAAVLCDQLAALYAGAGNPTIAADSVDYQGRSGEFARRAGGLRKRYYDALGIDPKRVVGHSAVVDLDLPNSQGQDRLTHSNRWR